MKRNFFWQPELATAIIYWSCSLIVLFYSLILALENTRPYWKSNLVLGIFIFLVGLGLKRRLYLKQTEITITYSRFWKKTRISLESIQEIEIANNYLKITTLTQSYSLMMRKKDLAFVKSYFSEMIPSKLQQKNDIDESLG
jgi:hypothetical protein